MSPQLLVVLLSPALSLHCPLRLPHAAVGWRAGTARLQAEPVIEDISLTLSGCKSGIGVGLDEKNKVDMIKPNSPASKVFQKGDQVISWNGEDMMKVEGGRMVQKKLREVVEGGRDSHTVVVKRERKAWESNFEPSSSWAASTWEDNAKW